MYKLKKAAEKRTKNAKRKYYQRLQFYWMILSLVLAPALIGCAPSEEAEDLVVLEQEEEAIPYNLSIASYGDVLLTEVMNVTYKELEEEELSFSVSGRLVSKVYVEEGEQVKKGQLLAELGDDDLISQAETLEYQIARNQILLEQSAINEDYDISTMWLQFLYQSGQTETEQNALKSSIAQIQQQYQYMREDYQDAIEIAQLRLESVRKELSTNKLYAGIDGTVTWVKTGLLGTTSEAGSSVIQIKNDEECLFAVEGSEHASLFSENSLVEMVISGGKNAGSYLMMPYHMEEWEDRLWFTMVDEVVEMETGTVGRITVVLDSRENVINIPKLAVHTANGESFVHCLGEDGLREVRWVKTGLYGDERVEILSGLEEGDRVILR